MQLPARMHLVSNKEILIYDTGNNRLSFYSFQGNIIREIPARKYRVHHRNFVFSLPGIISQFYSLLTS